MMDKSQKVSPDKSVNRRRFFRTAGVSAVSGVAALAIGNEQSEAASADPELNGDRSRYRETEHVRRVYQLARF